MWPQLLPSIKICLISLLNDVSCVILFFDVIKHIWMTFFFVWFIENQGNKEKHIF